MFKTYNFETAKKEFDVECAKLVQLGTSIFNAQKNIYMDTHKYYSGILKQDGAKDLNQLVDSINTNVSTQIEETKKYFTEKAEKMASVYSFKK